MTASKDWRKPVELDEDADPVAVARAIVLRQLTAAPRSRGQLATKLAQRGVPEHAAEQVLDRFEELKLIDDAEFAQLWVRSRSEHRSLAKGALRRELADKGIAPELAEEALGQLSDEQEVRQAKELLTRKLRSAKAPEGREERDKLVRRLASMLARKGYAPGMAFQLTNEALQKWQGSEL
ncbi:regulatory protein RecX [Pseudarthrobacter sp. J1738]|uniref:regulatory protein RecX n=1 Tax=Pseudarthrobacter sp. J1738 TaxID=3420446 RepID=UPI003D2B7C6A